MEFCKLPYTYSQLLVELGFTLISPGAGNAGKTGRIASDAKPLAGEACIGKAAAVVGSTTTAAADNTVASLGKSNSKSIASLEEMIAEHEAKLANYVQDPWKHDNKGFLKNTPNDMVRQK